MQFEVEQKFAVDDVAALMRRLQELGARERGAVEQADQYFNHPARDFAQTDEALRVRSVGDRNFITYKGPKLDATTKTRREIELPLADGAAAAAEYADLLTTLGFRAVAVVHKTRRRFEIDWQDKTIEVSLDQVSELGQFVELELIAIETDVDAAKASVASLASALELTRDERRSYLELLLAERRRTIASLPTSGR